MSAQPNDYDPQDRNLAARLHEMERLRLLRQPGAGTRMAERLHQAEATGNYHEFTTPKNSGDGRHDEPLPALIVTETARDFLPITWHEWAAALAVCVLALPVSYYGAASCLSHRFVSLVLLVAAIGMYGAWIYGAQKDEGQE